MTSGSFSLAKQKKPNPAYIFLTLDEWPAFTGSTMYFMPPRSMHGSAVMRGERKERRQISPFLAAICLRFKVFGATTQILIGPSYPLEVHQWSYRSDSSLKTVLVMLSNQGEFKF
jgi:hypothetical protein